jgi:hypothetical protein
MVPRRRTLGESRLDCSSRAFLYTLQTDTQTEAAGILGATQPDISDLARGKLSRFSRERLEHYLNELDTQIRIQVGPRPSWKDRAGIEVAVVESFYGRTIDPVPHAGDSYSERRMIAPRFRALR